MFIWQQPLTIAKTLGTIPVRPNSKYIPTGSSGTGNISVSTDANDMITAYRTPGSGGSITANHDFNKGPIIAFTGTWRWAGARQELRITVGSKTTTLVRTGNSVVTLDGNATTLVGNTSADMTIKFVVDMNAYTSSVYQLNGSTWTLNKTVDYTPDITSQMRGSVYVAGRDDPGQQNSSWFYNAGLYNNINLLAS